MSNNAICEKELRRFKKLRSIRQTERVCTLKTNFCYLQYDKTNNVSFRYIVVNIQPKP